MDGAAGQRILLDSASKREGRSLTLRYPVSSPARKTPVPSSVGARVSSCTRTSTICSRAAYSRAGQALFPRRLSKDWAFLLPIFATLMGEAIRWPAPSSGFLTRRWWQARERNSRRVGAARLARRRETETVRPLALSVLARARERPNAVRALILYPMNALVKDQLARLRKALDSDAARAAMGIGTSGQSYFFRPVYERDACDGFHRPPAVRGQARSCARVGLFRRTSAGFSFDCRHLLPVLYVAIELLRFDDIGFDGITS